MGTTSTLDVEGRQRICSAFIHIISGGNAASKSFHYLGKLRNYFDTKNTKNHAITIFGQALKTGRGFDGAC
jgi:hypothetical protein